MSIVNDNCMVWEDWCKIDLAYLILNLAYSEAWLWLWLGHKMSIVNDNCMVWEDFDVKLI